MNVGDDGTLFLDRSDLSWGDFYTFTDDIDSSCFKFLVVHEIRAASKVVFLEDRFGEKKEITIKDEDGK